jgi:hypothetical protein
VLRRLGTAALPVVLAALTGCGVPSGPGSPIVSYTEPVAPSGSAAPPPSAEAPAPGTARAALAALPVKGRAPRTGNSRDEFGPAWADVDRNGCDTRNDILARDLTATSVRPGTQGCVVLTGRLLDPYSGRAVPFRRGPASADVQIDHVVALSNAWQTGAFRWTAAKRRLFANDPANLLAVSGALNQQKGDGDAATWLPPARSAWCSFGVRQTTVKSRYGLWVTPAEKAALGRLLDRCPG